MAALTLRARHKGVREGARGEERVDERERTSEREKEVPSRSERDENRGWNEG